MAGEYGHTIIFVKGAATSDQTEGANMTLTGIPITLPVLMFRSELRLAVNFWV